MTIQPQSALLIGILLLFLVTVESGGYFLTKVVRHHVAANDLQRGFFRAGHAHAAVLLVLSVLILLVLDQVETLAPLELVARNGVPLAAVLMPAGFFLSVTGKNPEHPNKLIVLLWLGVASLTAGLLAAGISLVLAGASGLQGMAS
jgi:hypothetical protein